ncbi:MAG TPA: zinc ribbon domain-containing protein [Spirochaetota bacterium]|nr:zinc ribbon domain-containing protein [Anaerolineaceae bacterium]HXK66493.1 zinc ribbon domain-containing protein [Spirochaetota bacterium]
MSNQTGPLKGFRPLKSTDSSTPKPENPPSPTPPIGPNSTSYQPNQGFVRPTIINTTTSSLQKLICPFCSSPIPKGASFCSKCGNPIPKSSPISTQPLDIKCPQCGASNLPGSVYCSSCGAALTKNGQTQGNKLSNLNPHIHLPDAISNLKTDMERFWTYIGGAFAILAFICFFLPFLVLKINNAFSFLISGPDSITISQSGFQFLTASSPSISGVGSLGDTTENLYNELDMGKQIMQYADSSMRTMYIISRILTLIILLLSIANLVVVYQAYAIREAKWSKWMMAIGVVAPILLIIFYSTAGISFKTGTEELDLLVNSMVKISNGFGFWGMLIGFLGIAFSGYMRSKSHN